MIHYKSTHIILVSLVLILIFQHIAEAKGTLIELDLIRIEQKQNGCEDNRMNLDYGLNNKKQINLKKQLVHNRSNNLEQNKMENRFEGQQDENKVIITQSDLRNFNNNQYLVNIFLGSNSQKLSLIVDSGSSYTVAEGIKCENCTLNNAKEDLYDCTKSSNCTLLSKTPYELNFMQGKAIGLLNSDVVCLENNQGKCTNTDFIFLDVYDITDTLKTNQGQGILGVGLYKDNLKISFIHSLYRNGQIPEPSFSLYISDASYDKRHQKYVSKLIIGGIDLKYGAEKSTLVTHQVETKDNWNLSLEYVRFNDKSVQSEGVKFALIDSGTSYLMLPKQDFNDLLSYLNISNKCILDDNQYIQCSCPTGEVSNYPVIHIKFNTVDTIYELAPSDYIIQENHVCNLLISHQSYKTDTWIIGDVFLRKYMGYFNVEKETIGFILSNRKLLENELAKDTLLILECFLGSFFLGILIIYFIRLVSGLKNSKDEDLTF